MISRFLWASTLRRFGGSSSALTRVAARQHIVDTPRNYAIRSKRATRDITLLPQTEEEEIRNANLTPVEQMEQLMRAQAALPHTDLYGQGLQLFDLEMPYSVHIKHLNRYPSVRAAYDQFKVNQRNNLKNGGSMWSLIYNNAIPGFDTSNPTWGQRLFRWPRYVFQAKSISPRACIAPFRAYALDLYKQMNIASATRDAHALQKLTLGRIAKPRQKLLHSHRGLTKIWRYHGEVTPVRILSIRAAEMYTDPLPPKIGNRMYTQVLFRFDTMQSLELYDADGKPAHPIPQGAQKKRDGTIEAERIRVTEYLVMEKRMWYDTPWQFRAQFYEEPGKAPTVGL